MEINLSDLAEKVLLFISVEKTIKKSKKQAERGMEQCRIKY